MQSSWASWESINAPQVALRYGRRHTNVERREAKERYKAAATTKMWAEIGEQRGINLAQPPSARLEIAAAAIEDISMTLEQMALEMGATCNKK